MNRTLALNPPISINFNLRFLWIASFVLIVGLLVFHIFQVNAMTKGYYLLEGYEDDIARLSQGNKSLEISLSQINSLGNIEEEIIGLNFVRAEQVTYIHLMNTSVAKSQ